MRYIIKNTENRWPMDKISTSDLKLTEKLLKSAISKDLHHSPTAASLEFIKNFAHNFRVYCDVEGRASELILN